jgi:DNA-binding NtrC family response regulator
MRSLLRLLIVSDSPEEAGDIEALLTHHGQEVSAHRVENASQLRAAYTEAPWDAVLVNWTHARIPGEEAIAIHQRSGLDLPLLVVAGLADPEKARSIGAHAVVPPGEWDRLEAAIAHEREQARERRRARQAEAMRAAAD